MRIARHVLLAAMACLGFVALLRSDALPSSALDLVSEGGQALAAVLATLGSALAASRSRGRRRRAWAWIAAGCASWALGQGIWTFYETVLDREVPYPSPADIGFLGSPVLVGWGLVRWLGTSSNHRVARGRDVLDGAIVASSLLVVSWVTALGAVVDAGLGDGWFPFVLSLAYPLGDIVVITLAVMTLSRSGDGDRGPLWVLTAGLVVVAAADSAFVFLTSMSSYSSTDLACAGWFLGFWLIGSAGWAAAREQGRPLARARRRRTSTSRVQIALPYVPFTGAIAMITTQALRGDRLAAPVVVTALLLVALVLLRQFLTVLDNQRLVSALAEARDQLEHRTLHDALTGLPNRVLFADRLKQALTHARPDVSVLFCDLDDFKPVNDRFGHAAGDLLLVEVARRLTSCVRSGDTVARISGDEFAVLLEHGDLASEVAERIVTAMGEPIRLYDDLVASSMSIGIAEHDDLDDARMGRADAALAATELVRRADAAMYEAKAAGKGRVVSDRPASIAS